MNVRLLMLTGLSALVLATQALPAVADESRPFLGRWEGSTVSATPLEPNVVLVVSSGSGRATHLGRLEMTSPHLTFLETFELVGEHNYTAANGDELFADFSGQLMPNADGSLEGTLESVIVGGTGRFEGATGSYDFHIIARLAEFGFDSTATIRGTIEY